ncbi:MAG: DUF456 domain-containing protein [Propionibacteriales bacterium]|nr:DUF456 domain-containing protein [Propionibacteriales bacterium]
MSLLVVLVALAIALGLVGIVIPMLPGSLLVAAAILVWAAVESSTGAWVTLAIALGLVATGTITKYLVPGKRLQRSGVPGSTLLIGGVLGVVGFFVVPVVGLPFGFVAGVYLAEWRRTSHSAAGPATWHALKAVGLGIVIEFTFSVLAAGAWATGVVVT